jgi:hypothetical protein
MYVTYLAFITIHSQFGWFIQPSIYKYFGQFLSKTFLKTEVSGKYEIGDLAVVKVSGG